MEAQALDADLLFGAIRGREGLRSIRHIVTNNPQVLLQKSPEGRSPLLEAIIFGASLGVIRFLVEQRPQALQEQDCNGCLPAHYAALIEGATISMLRCVVEPYPHALLHLDCHGYTPLHHAVSAAKSVAKVRYLANKCPAAVRTKSTSRGEGALPLHLACSRLWELNRLKIMLILVEKWPESILEKIREADTAWEVCVWLAERRREHGVHYRRLIEAIFELCPQAIRARGSTGLLPLQLAVSIDAPNWMVRHFLDLWPASILSKSACGMSILHVAAVHSETTVITLERIRFLVERDSRIVALRSSGDGSCPLHAVASIHGPPPDVIRYLVERHPQALRKKDKEGRTPLHCAVDSGLTVNFSVTRSLDEIYRCWTETAEFLIAQRPESLHVKDRRGDLPLHILAQQPDEDPPHELFECLVRNGPAAVAVRNRSGYTPLHLVADVMDPSIVRMLAEYCPEALAVADTSSRRLPLHILCCARPSPWRSDDEIPDVVREFIALRPESVRQCDNDGCIPLHCASSKENCDGVSLELIRILLAEHPEGARVATLQDGCLPLHLVLSVRYLNIRQVLPLAQLLIEAYPESLQVKNKKGLVPVLVAASNPTASLDLLWQLLKDYPDSIPVPGQPQPHRSASSSSSPGRSSKRPRRT